MNEHAVLVIVWLGTGTIGLICGIVSVAVAKRRIKAVTATTGPTHTDDALAA